MERDTSKLQFGHGSSLWNYWTKGKGLAKWAGAEHKWTALHAALLKAGVPPHVADGLTTNIITHVFPGYMKAKHNGGKKSAMSNDFCLRSVEFRSTADAGDGRTLQGYAAVFGTPTRIDSSYEGNFEESIAPGAFSKTLKERTPVLQFDHGRDARTGTVPIGKVETIREDSNGLYVSARLYDNPVVEPIRQAIEGGSIDGMSFRFRVVKDEWRDGSGKTYTRSEATRRMYQPDYQGDMKRTLREVALYEAGPVVFPAYEGTSVGVRTMLGSLSDEERAQLVAELAQEMEAVREGTSEKEDEAGRQATSGLSEGERAAFLREMDLKGV